LRAVGTVLVGWARRNTPTCSARTRRSTSLLGGHSNFRELLADDVEHAVFGQCARFEGRLARDFVPMLVERASRDTLAHQHRPAHRASARLMS
jgi:hypothetical protein